MKHVQATTQQMFKKYKIPKFLLYEYEFLLNYFYGTHCAATPILLVFGRKRQSIFHIFRKQIMMTMGTIIVIVMVIFMLVVMVIFVLVVMVIAMVIFVVIVTAVAMAITLLFHRFQLSLDSTEAACDK